MSVVEQVLLANKNYVQTFPGPRPLRPKLRLAVIACMDSRIAVFGAFGLAVGDAHIIRNAGGLVTPDVLRSLAISQRKMGTCEVILTHHTDCGMSKLDDTAFRDELAAESGEAPPWDVPGFHDPAEQVRLSLETIRACQWLPSRDQVRGFVFDVASARLIEIN